MEKKKIKVEQLIESLPYIQQFTGKIFVFKCGGRILDNIRHYNNFIQDIVLLNHLGMQSVIIHGGGSQISSRLKEKGIVSEFHLGYRITCDESIKEVEMVLSGEINRKLVLDFNNAGIKTIGLNGKDAGLIKATKKKIGNKDIGNVGTVESVNTEYLQLVLDHNYLPIISPIGFDTDGNTYNINADDIASEIAQSIKAEKLFLVTDIDGIYEINDGKKEFISKLNIEQADALLQKDCVQGGMIPKLKACIDALNNGVTSVHIVNGQVDHSVLLEVFTDDGIGTMIKGGISL